MFAEHPWEILSTLFSGGGALTAFLFFRKWSKEIRAAIKALKEFVKDIVGTEYEKMYNHFLDATETVLRQYGKDSQTLDLGSILRVDSAIRLEKSAIRDIHCANKFIDQWDSCLARIQFYRWLFSILFVLSGALWFWNNQLPNQKFATLAIVMSGFAMAFAVVLLVDYLVIQTSLDKARRKHELP